MDHKTAKMVATHLYAIALIYEKEAQNPENNSAAIQALRSKMARFEHQLDLFENRLNHHIAD